MKLHVFNPENDLALADGNSNYCPPPMARAIASDLATLPLWFAASEDCVLLPSVIDVEYALKMSSIFTMPHTCMVPPVNELTAVAPWGWSAQMKRRLRVMGVDEALLPGQQNLELLRTLSNRRAAIDVMRALRLSGIDTPEIPLYLSSPACVAAFINSMPRSVIKAPWSGSGKGIAWGIGRVEVPVEHFYCGVIKRQGGVVCERYLDKVVDFAMEFSMSHGVVSFAGYSLFTCDGGAYSGNILAGDAEIEDFLQEYVSREVIAVVKERLAIELTRLLQPLDYNGILGVDMMIYRVPCGFALNPCVELNLRMNMGAVSRIFYDRFVSASSRGRFSVTFYKQPGEALKAHEEMSASSPLCVQGGRVVRGYLPLSPVATDTRYAAFALIDTDSSSLSERYFSK